MYKAKNHHKQLAGAGGKEEERVPDSFLENMLHDDTKRFLRIMF